MRQAFNNTITADQFQSSVSASSPILNQDALKQIIQKWISKQGKHWPSKLDVDELTKNLRLVHLPYWVVSGKGTAQWSASIGVERQVPKRCSTCGGRGRYTPLWSTDERRCDNCAGTGQALGPETFWTSQSGFVEAEANYQLQENFDPNGLDLKCGERQFKANRFGVDDTQASEYNTITPISTSSNSGKNAAKIAVEDALRSQAHSIASGMGYVRDLQVGYAQTTSLQSEIWLYPMFLGYYSAGNEQLPIQIDGITKKMFADVPSNVKSLRRKDRNRKIAYGLATLVALAILVLIVDFLVMSLHPCGNLDNLISNPTNCMIGINPSDIYGWEQAAISPDGQVIAIRNGLWSTNYIELRQLQDGKLLHRLTIGATSQKEGLSFSPDGKLLAIGDDNAVTLWRVSDGEKMRSLASIKTSAGESNFAWTLDFSPNGKILAAGHRDGTTRLLSIEDLQVLHILKGDRAGAIRALAFSPDGKLLITGDSDGSVRLWDVSSGDFLKSFRGHNRWISGVAFSSDNEQIISSSGNNTIKIWDASSGELMKTIQIDIDGNGWIEDLEMSPDGTILALSIYNHSNNSRVQLWDIEKERLLETTTLGLPAFLLSLRERQNEIIGLDYTLDGNLFMIQKQDVGSRGILSVDQFFSPGDLFPAIVVREIEP